MALAAVWEHFWAPQGAQAGPGGPRGERKIRRIFPKWLWLQSGSISGLPRVLRPDQADRGGKEKSVGFFTKWLWLQSGNVSGLPSAARHREEIAVLLSSNLRIKILIRSLAISGSEACFEE